MKRLILASLLAVVLLGGSANLSRAGEAPRLSPRQELVRQEVDSWAAWYGQSPAYLEGVVACESDFEPDAVGAHGEQGPAQFMPSGGIWSITPYGEEGLTPFDVSTDEQIHMMVWLFFLGYACQWSCA